MRGIRSLLLTGITAAVCLNPQNALAVLIVDATATPAGGSLFEYQFTVTNSVGAFDVPIVNINNGPLFDPDIAASLVAPAGFLAIYDSGLGIVSFLEFTSTFSEGASVGGFSFLSSAAPPGFFTTFDALDVVGNFLQGDVNLTTAAAVAEPDGILLLASVLLVLGLAARRRRSRFR